MLDRDGFIEILRLIESYVFRRVICSIPTNTLNRTFASLSREIDKESYVESVKVALLQKDSYRRFPTNEEFRRNLMIRDIYNLRTRNYLLGKLENSGRKEPVYVTEFTIEHVLPQNAALSQAWRDELGPEWAAIQARMLHTLGNLTLTGYNSEMSDRPFREKRDMAGGFADSPLRLNHSLARRERWNEAEILERAGMLADLALDVWRFPALPPGVELPASTTLTTSAPPLSQYRTRFQAAHRPMFDELRKRVLNLSASVQEVFNQRYIAYRAESTFLTVRARQLGLLLRLHQPHDEMTDSLALGQPVGNDITRVILSDAEQLEAVMDLVSQAFEWRTSAAMTGGDEEKLEAALADDEIEEVTVESIRQMLGRIDVPQGQRQLYAVLYRAEGGWVSLPDLAAAIGRERRELPGLLGALGRRINETPGLGLDLDGNRRGISAVIDVEWPSISGTGEWRYRMTPMLREALEAEGLV